MLGLTLVLLPATVGAQSRPSTDVQRQQAGDLVKKAIAKSQAGDHVLAIELYQQAYNIIPTALLLSNIGSEYQAMGNKPVEALKYFCKYLEADPTGSNSSYATAQVKTLQIQQGMQVDDKDVCKPLPPAGTGSGAGANDGGAGSAAITANVGPATTAEPESSPGRTMELAGIGVAGVGAVGVVIGIVYALKGKSLSDFQSTHNKSDPWPATYDGVAIADWTSQGHAWNTDAYIFSIGGGVAVLAGATLFYLGHGKSAAPTEHVSLVPTASPTSSGLALTGSF